jgi:glutamine amidotransferase
LPAESICDSAVLAAHVFAEDPIKLGELVRRIASKDPAARLNVLVADGTRILATNWGNELCYRQFPDGVVVASEPYDDLPGWIDVPDRHLVIATRDTVDVTPLEA